MGLQWVCELIKYAIQWRAHGEVSLAKVHVDRDGINRVTGKRDELQQSQHYTAAFGDAVAEVYIKHAQQLRAMCQEQFRSAKEVASPADLWSEAMNGDDKREGAWTDNLFAFHAR